MQIALYDCTTGKINRFVSCPPKEVYLQVQEGEDFYLNCPLTATNIINNEPVTVAAPSPTLAQVKQSKLKELSDARYSEEIGGILYKGIKISTDRTVRNSIKDTLDFIKNSDNKTINLKGISGWLTLSYTELSELCTAINEHVQTCFDKEKELNIVVEKAKTIKAVSKIQW